jgi:protein MpaA
MLFIIISCSSDLGTTKPVNKTVKPSGTERAANALSKKTIQKQSIEAKKIPKQTKVENTQKVKKYCQKIETYFKKYRWGKSYCSNYNWHHVRDSYLGNPIIWKVFGNEEAHKVKHKNATLIFCGVHGDEITPVKFCFDILHDLLKNPDTVGEDNIVIIAPLVAPDSFLKTKPTRYNARGVDVNRNFPTKDWDKNAIKLWKSRYKSDKRRYPGKVARSEHETVFQINLIKRYNPDKIISVHAPLTLIDYDGPEEENTGNNARQLLIQMSDKAGKYRINNYPFFTGSLGNWAGNERSIPTYTLELPNSDWTKTKKFYMTFRNAIHHAIDHDLKSDLKPKKKVSKQSKKNDPVL